MAKRIGLSALGGSIRYRHGEITSTSAPGPSTLSPETSTTSVGSMKPTGRSLAIRRESNCWARHWRMVNRSRSSGLFRAVAAAYLFRFLDITCGRSMIQRSALYFSAELPGPAIEI